MKLFLKALPLAALLVFGIVSFAVAGETDNGQGVYGEANDKVVTYVGFMVMGFFVVFVSAMSVLQWKLDKRKTARLDAKKAHAARDRGGW